MPSTKPKIGNKSSLQQKGSSHQPFVGSGGIQRHKMAGRMTGNQAMATSSPTNTEAQEHNLATTRIPSFPKPLMAEPNPISS
jgi:hypothetical protein